MALGKICKVDGCTRILRIQDGPICPAHKSRFWRHGSYDVSPNWSILKKGQPWITNCGYLALNHNSRRIQYHRYIMEQHLGRRLTGKERVHHKDGNKLNNDIENLELFKSESEHKKKCHPYMWKKRKFRPPLNAKTIANILRRLSIKSCGQGKEAIMKYCFCGNKTTVRNLCDKHYKWARRHKFI